ncbi:MAG: pyridoxal 5'-phosphate synthase glutaminase subunit PdxT [Anaerolineaceae bacterium]|nr:pyridoxal 5'-phosphate synthase glutaminase subunit PdxT [Anaerolineaceae bacterium]
MKIGVLALQGAFIEHQKILEKLGAKVAQVRLPEHLIDLDGLIIPGGESTTIGKMAEEYGLLEPLQQFGKQKPLWGTCAGAIFLAKNIGLHQPLLGLMDITVERNAFGRQIDSFEAELSIPCLGSSNGYTGLFPAVFIRAPLINDVGEGVEVLSKLTDGRIVAVRQGHLLATSFHPELTGDTRFHKYFLELIK